MRPALRDVPPVVVAVAIAVLDGLGGLTGAAVAFGVFALALVAWTLALPERFAQLHPGRLALAGVVLGALCWTVLVVMSAIVDGEGSGGVFLTALLLLVAIAGGLSFALRRLLQPSA
jgi:hypothetical protein